MFLCLCCILPHDDQKPHYKRIVLMTSVGPLHAVLASPRFHRWHHTSPKEGRDTNFAGLLPLWDILFGTYSMLASQPARFGIHDAVSTDLLGQLIWPFRRDQLTVNRAKIF